MHPRGKRCDIGGLLRAHATTVVGGLTRSLPSVPLVTTVRAVHCAGALDRRPRSEVLVRQEVQSAAVVFEVAFLRKLLPDFATEAGGGLDGDHLRARAREGGVAELGVVLELG